MNNTKKTNTPYAAVIIHYLISIIAITASAYVSCSETTDKTEEKKFEIYFNFDSSDITPEAQNSLRTVINYLPHGLILGVNISGHTDSFGSKSYNKKLSKRRALAIKKWLNQNEISADAIKTNWYGEEQLPFPTGDNHREPLNRCVVVNIWIKITTNLQLKVSNDVNNKRNRRTL